MTVVIPTRAPADKPTGDRLSLRARLRTRDVQIFSDKVQFGGREMKNE
jgi:hypothetical protein